MGRPSKLSPEQWAEIERRLLEGETARALGREFDLSEGAIRKRFGAHQSISAQSTQVRSAAQKVADANIALRGLTPAQRPVAVSMGDRLTSISESLAAGAELGAKTMHRLHALANSEVGKVDDADPLSPDSIAALKNVGILTKLGNDSAHVALNLLQANKERIQKLDDAPDADAAPTSGVLKVPGMSMTAVAWSAAVTGKDQPTENRE